MPTETTVSPHDAEYLVKMRKRNAATRAWYFLSGRGDSYNRLRIHACRFSGYAVKAGDSRTPKQRAEDAAREIETLNPEFETKVVKA